jgi:hypothetical protein
MFDTDVGKSTGKRYRVNENLVSNKKLKTICIDDEAENDDNDPYSSNEWEKK